MKVTVDLDKLLVEGEINQDEYDKFNRFAARNTATLAFNILVGFGVLAVSCATLALVPTPVTAIALGLIVCAVGIALVYAQLKQWMVFAHICVAVGALMFGGGVVVVDAGSVGSFLLVSMIFAITGVLVRSTLLIVLAVFALSSCVGARTGYFHATYFLGIEEPALTVALFGVFSIATFQLSKHIASHYEGMAVAASRTGVFLVNFGFWIGSLWGDRLGTMGAHITEGVFAALWALALIAAGVWAWRQNRRWLVNLVAVFGAIHFYTQWFERLGAEPGTVLLAGLFALGFAVGLQRLNKSLSEFATSDEEAPARRIS